MRRVSSPRCTLIRWSRRSRMTPLGVRGFPVVQGGKAAWHRPHSVHAYRSKSAFHEKSRIVEAPSFSASTAKGLPTPEGSRFRRKILAGGGGGGRGPGWGRAGTKT